MRILRSSAFAVIAGIAAVGTPADASAHGWSTASGIGRDVLVVAALGVPAVQGDWRGDLEDGGSMLLAEGVTYGLKHTIHEERPDHSDNRSFPSGHTSLSFAAAASLEKRYGWQVGLPALVVASFVGVGRVEAHKHHWYDAVTGAAIGGGAGFVLTSRHDERVRLLPWAEGTHGGGLALSARF